MKRIRVIFLAFKEMYNLEKLLIPLSIAVAVVMAIMPFVNIWFMSKILDLLELKSNINTLSFYIILATVLNFIFIFLNNYLNDVQLTYRALMYNKELQNIARKLYKTGYQKHENSQFKELVHKHSEAQNRVFSSFVQFAWMLRDFISGLITVTISVSIITPLLIIGIKTTGDSYFEKPFFLLTIFGVALILVTIVLIVSIKMNKFSFESSNEYSKIDRSFYFFLNMFSNYKTGKEIRIFKEQELIENAATDKLLTDGESILKKAAVNTAKSSSIIAILGTIVGFGVYLFIGVKGFYGLFSIGSLVLYCGTFMQIINGVMKMAVTFGKTEEMLPLINYYLEIINSEDEMSYGNQEIDLSTSYEIEFKNVSFKYPNSDKYALKRINIKINKGDHLAIVGKNGSGKTTFVKLLCRLYDVTEGEILINKINLKEYTKESILSLYAVVFQDFNIFSTTVAENISATDNYDYYKLYDSLEKADLKERVLKLKFKENTYIYKNLDALGVEFSSGEAQKLALARALYKDAPFVILDEPTASMDPIAESNIYNKFNSFTKNKTTIYISHRLSSCYFCDKIVVFNSGEIVEIGNHQQLIQTDGIYRELWHAQAQYYT